MISITTQQNQFAFRLSFSLNGIGKKLQTLSRLLSFEQVREVERQKRKMLAEAGFNYWRA